MLTQTVPSFERTVQKTHLWLKDLMDELGWDDERRAYHALRATLHALRDRLTPEEAAELAAQLPMLVRGFYFEGWHPSGKPVKERHLGPFLEHIAHSFRRDPGADPEVIARAVFRLLATRVTDGEIEDIRGILPREISRLFPPAPAVS
jgi:uncharacterized protein (DUF2267 family)